MKLIGGHLYSDHPVIADLMPAGTKLPDADCSQVGLHSHDLFNPFRSDPSPWSKPTSKTCKRRLVPHLQAQIGCDGSNHLLVEARLNEGMANLVL